MPYVLLLLLLSSGPKLGKGICRVLWGIGTKNLSKHVVLNLLIASLRGLFVAGILYLNHMKVINVHLHCT